MVEQLGLVTMRAFPAFRLLLFRQEAQVIGVHLGNQQRHQRIHPVVARVADDEVTGGGEGLLDVAGHRRVEGGKDHARTAAGDAGVHLAAGERVGNRRGESPRRDSAVRLAFGSLARRQPRGREPRMARQADTNCWPTTPVAPRMPTSR